MPLHLLIYRLFNNLILGVVEMEHKYVGKLVGKQVKIGIVVSRFNELITAKLLEGAMNTLQQFDVALENIHIVEVPGAFEIPLVAQKLSERKDIDAIITLGAVIRGETPHFDYVCSEVASGVTRVSLDSKKPVIFGVLTTDTIDQALSRTGVKLGNKGSEAAIAAIEMVNVLNMV